MTIFNLNIPIRRLWTNLHHKDHFLNIWPLLHYFSEIYLKTCNFASFFFFKKKKRICPLKKITCPFEITFCLTACENIFQWIKLQDMISRKLFNFRLGSTCSHLAALLFMLQAYSIMDLYKVACKRKVSAW